MKIALQFSANGTSHLAGEGAELVSIKHLQAAGPVQGDDEGSLDVAGP